MTTRGCNSISLLAGYRCNYGCWPACARGGARRWKLLLAVDRARPCDAKIALVGADRPRIRCAGLFLGARPT